MGKSGQVMAHSAYRSCLVIGANGLVGSRVGKVLDNNGIDWIGTCNRRASQDFLQFDITKQDDLTRLFLKIKPKAVFHCANLAGGVDFCESNPEIARNFHFKATAEIGRLCKDYGAFFIYISTDYVFDGTKGPYRETDKPNPLNLHGRLKLEAEDWTRANLKDYVIARTTNVYGWDPMTVTPNYVMSLYNMLKDKKTANAPSFLWGNPTYSKDLAEALVELWENWATGVYHVVGPSFVSRFEWAKKVCKALGLDTTLIREVKEPSNGMVPRPLKSWLSTDKFTASFKTPLHNLDEGLKLMRQDMDNG